MSKQKIVDQEATALNNFGVISYGRDGKMAGMTDCNGVALANKFEKSLVAEVTVTSAQVLALFTTPIEIIPAPGAGYAVIPHRFVVRHGTGTAYAGIAAGEDLVLKYTNASGAEITQTIETTGFLDQATAQIRMAGGINASITPVSNAAVVLHLLVGNITTGTFDLEVFVEYDVIPTDFAG
jgi:hypothetical protein